MCVLGLFVLAFWAALKNEQVKTTAVTSPSVERTALLRGNWENVKVSNVVLCFVQIALKAWNSKNVKVFSETKRLCANSDQQLNNMKTENMKLPVNIISPEWELIVQRLCYNCDTCTYTESKRDVWTMRHFTAAIWGISKALKTWQPRLKNSIFFLHIYREIQMNSFLGTEELSAMWKDDILSSIDFEQIQGFCVQEMEEKQKVTASIFNPRTMHLNDQISLRRSFFPMRTFVLLRF